MRLLPRFKRKKINSAQAPIDLATQFPDFDRRTIEIIRKVQPYTMTSPERIGALCQSVRYLVNHGIEGAIVECGVWKGGSMLAAIEVLNELDASDRQLWLYDTFDGMTEPGEGDVDYMGQTAQQLLATQSRDDNRSVWCRTKLNEVQTLLKQSGYPFEKMHFIQGPVEKTLPNQLPPRIAMLRLDTDWYKSTKHELVYLFPRLVPGGVLIIDDYGHWEGCRRAVDEYFRDHQVPILLQRIDYTGRIGIKPNSLEPASRKPESTEASNIERASSFEINRSIAH